LKPIMHWAVGLDDGRRVCDVVSRMRAHGAPENARVFVNGRRADPDDLVEPGDRVELYPNRTTLDPDVVNILTQRDGIVFALKPAGMPTETTKLGETSVVSALMAQLSGGTVHAATRLDVQVSGVVALTLGKDARRRFERWREQEQLVRTYVGICSGVVKEEHGEWRWPLKKVRDRAGRHRVVTEAPGAKPSLTRFVVMKRAQNATMLELRPVTGRMHQLRAHAHCAGVPLFGDRLYGGPRQVVQPNGAVLAIQRIALHAWRIETPTLKAEAPLPEALETLWSALAPQS
jgi:23S rRNA-/tRNA-specific pseudouridylate synthase